MEKIGGDCGSCGNKSSKEYATDSSMKKGITNALQGTSTHSGKKAT